ncbi:MAG: enoyl-CoA hydratase/isomerase family protein [Gammaproteobacteria bacterium]|nr:enoyl-CoA hydratase/isomerase family protein [Gammaproteobacteria bacterium]MBU0849068.1 enoyl-CoA hydratase/isomerase family protein [Gammaproteobacteria bacterium]MBU1266639.1 enoyl-CoA hydratase/isomerase family protein [Gammaproteobacteria bacterium]MBU1529894.1 enoyl-CoA hydratase/isomerase family protein [Gammaproteobacteria bacterium]MBU1781405.1 enoyl-CoA hydratase/isomerase family protein [Gammaproteobacteria bacterium]
MSAPVTFSTFKTASGHLFGHAALNNPSALNALTLPMIDLLDPQLKCWAEDTSIAGVVLSAAGEKSFCAGGDVVSLHHASKRVGAGNVPPEAEMFFEREYRLDYRIHTYPKPILCWAHGIVMGGGVGLMVGASHRVVSPNARIAMPEIHIGLYPDVGGTWFLQRMPGRMGLFLALTGAIINAGDAKLGNWADAVIAHEQFSRVLAAIEKAQWHGQLKNDSAALSTLLKQFETQAPTPLLTTHADAIDSVVNHATLAEVDVALRQLQHHTNPWLAKAAQAYAHGSPTSAALAYELMKQNKNAELADVLRLEYQASVGCCAHPDFPEGVRALLVDKDKSPKWKPDCLTDVSVDAIADILKPGFKGVHPLHDLGKPINMPALPVSTDVIN